MSVAGVIGSEQSQKKRRAYAPLVFSCFVGLLLLVSAIAKIASFSGLLSYQYFFFFHPAVFALVVIGEILLGCWHLFGERSRQLYIVTALILGCFSIVNATSLVVGRDSCGCFGSFDVHPLWMLILDVALVFGALLIANHTRGEPGTAKQTKRKLGLAIPVMFVGVVVFGLSSSYSPHQLIKGAYIHPDSLDFGQLRAGSRNERTITVINTSSKPISLLGAASSCGTNCNVDLPLVIEPYSQAEMVVLVRPNDVLRGKKIMRGIRIFTDSDLTPIVENQFVAWVK